MHMSIKYITFAYVSSFNFVVYFVFNFITLNICVLNPTVKVLAKHTAWQHTYDNFYSTRWVTYCGNLVGGDTPLYKHITKEIEEANIRASQRERCESFILKWVKEHAKPETNKVSF